MPPIHPRLLTLAACLALAACATPADTPAAATPPAANPEEPAPRPMPAKPKPSEPAPGEPAMECNDSAAAWAVGQDADTNLIERVRVDTGAVRVRVLKPGQMVTMEFRADRVNIDVDAENRVLRVRCG